MAIDLNRETIVTFAKLAAGIPRRRENRPVSPSTIHRWRRYGVRGIRLEAIRIGGAWHTSLEAFQRFCERLTVAETRPESDGQPAEPAPNAEEAGKVLDMIGL